MEQRGGRFGSTPLFIACYRVNVEAAKLLVEARADPDARDGSSSGISCRGMAARRGLDELVALMDEKKRKAGDLTIRVRSEPGS